MKTRKTSWKLLSILAISITSMSGSIAQGAEYLTHAPLSEDLVAHVAPANNVYDSNPTTVTWAGVGGAAIYENRSTCSPFVTRVVKAAYGISDPAHFSDSAFKSWFGSSSPSASQYYEAIVGQNRFQRILNPLDIKRGDLIAASYLPCANKTTTGHVMIALSAAAARTVDSAPIIAGTTQYEVTIADSSSSGHDATDSLGNIYPDTRTSGNGAGIGTLRIYKSTATGKISGYSWSMSKYSEHFSVDSCRPIAVGRMQ